MCDREGPSRFGPEVISPCDAVLAAEERIKAASASCDNCGEKGATHSIDFGPGNSVGDGIFCCNCKQPKCKPNCISEQADEEVHPYQEEP